MRQSRAREGTGPRANARGSDWRFGFPVTRSAWRAWSCPEAWAGGGRFAETRGSSL